MKFIMQIMNLVNKDDYGEHMRIFEDIRDLRIIIDASLSFL